MEGKLLTKRPVEKGFSQEQVVGCEYEQGIFIIKLLLIYIQY